MVKRLDGINEYDFYLHGYHSADRQDELRNTRSNHMMRFYRQKRQHKGYKESNLNRSPNDQTPGGKRRLQEGKPIPIIYILTPHTVPSSNTIPSGIVTIKPAAPH